MGNPFAVIRRLLEREQALGEFIKDGPSDGIAGWARDKYRHRCNEFANLPGWARALTGVAGGSVSRICEPYWADQGVDGPVLAPPFQGGQCAARYLFNVVGTVPTGVNSRGECVGSQPLNVVSAVWGPILGFGRGPGDCEGGPGGGTFTLTVTGFGPASGPRLSSPVTINAAQPAYTAVPTNIRLQNGQPDDCGDPPPEPRPGPNPPPDPGPLPGPEPTDDPGGRPFPRIPIPPFPDPVFGPQPLDDDDDGEGGGEDDPTDPPADPTDPPPGDIGEPGPPQGTGEGGVASGCAPEGSVLTGVKVTVVRASPFAKEFAPGVYRGACYVYIGVLGNLDHDPAGSMLRSGQFVFAEKDNLTCWEVRANIGFDLRVTPYYRSVEEEE